MTAKRTDPTAKKVLAIVVTIIEYSAVAFLLTAPLH